MRAMVLEFPEDRSAHTSDTQYMLGGALCVSPVLSADGRAETYLPEGTWRHLLTEEAVQGSRWVSRQYGFDSLGLFVRPGCVVPLGAMTDVPEYAWAEDVTLQLKKGEIHALLGENGAGKSNLYRSLQLVQAAVRGNFAHEIAAEGGMACIVGGKAGGGAQAPWPRLVEGQALGAQVEDGAGHGGRATP